MSALGAGRRCTPMTDGAPGGARLPDRLGAVCLPRRARAGGLDIRRVGSGNVGAANVLRSAGLAGRGLDGAASTSRKAPARCSRCGRRAERARRRPPPGVAAIAGHIYPVWLRFRGGKGVATSFGVFVALAPIAALRRAGAVRRRGPGHAVRVARFDGGGDRASGRWSMLTSSLGGPHAGGVRQRLPGALQAPAEPGAAGGRDRTPPGRLGPEREGARIVAREHRGSGSGELGHGAGRAPGPGRAPRAPVGDRGADRRRDDRRAGRTPSTCRTSRCRPTCCRRPISPRPSPGVDVVVVAIPSHAMRAVARAMTPLLRPGAIVVSVAKGLEQDTLLPHVGGDGAGDRRARIRSSCCRGRASPSRWRANCRRPCRSRRADLAAAERVQDEFRGRLVPPLRDDGRRRRGDRRRAEERRSRLRPAWSKASASATTRWRRSSRAGSPRSRGWPCAEGGRRETLAGLTGLGDLSSTCTGPLSRNRHVGIELARGRSLAEILAGMKMVAEGVRTTDAALALGARARRRAADRRADGERARRAQDAARGARGPDAPAAADRGRCRMIRITQMGLFGRVRDGLRRTAQQLRRTLRRDRRAAPTRPSGASAPVDAETADALEELLIGADVGVAAAERIVDGRHGARARHGESLRDLVKDESAGDSRAASDAATPPRTGSPTVRAGRRRQRHRQDHHRRQARQPVQDRRGRRR